MMVMYGTGHEHWPVPDDGIPPVPITPIEILPFDLDEINRRVEGAMKKKSGKVDPPPDGADRELEAIRQIVTALESLDVLVASLASQLTPEECKRVMRYIGDRYGIVLPSKPK